MNPSPEITRSAVVEHRTSLIEGPISVEVVFWDEDNPELEHLPAALAVPLGLPSQEFASPAGSLLEHASGIELAGVSEAVLYVWPGAAAASPAEAAPASPLTPEATLQQRARQWELAA